MARAASSKSKTLLWCGRASPGRDAPTKKKQPGLASRK
jgi:hypothetical protein